MGSHKFRLESKWYFKINSLNMDENMLHHRTSTCGQISRNEEATWLDGLEGNQSSVPSWPKRGPSYK